jgi:ribosomal protein L24E
MNTIKVGELIVQEHNMVTPDGKKVWIVRNKQHVAVYHSQSKRDAIAWAKQHQQA